MIEVVCDRKGQEELGTGGLGRPAEGDVQKSAQIAPVQLDVASVYLLMEVRIINLIESWEEIPPPDIEYEKDLLFRSARVKRKERSDL